MKYLYFLIFILTPGLSALASTPKFNLLFPGMTKLETSQKIAGWRTAGVKGKFIFEETGRLYNTNKIYRFVPQESNASVSLYSPPFTLNKGLWGNAEIFLKGRLKARIYIIDHSWKKNNSWENARVGGNWVKFNCDKFEPVSEMFISPDVAKNRKFMFRVDLSTDTPIEFTAPALTLHELSTTNLLKYPDIIVNKSGKITGWNFQGKQVPGSVTTQGSGIIRLESTPGKTIKTSLYSTASVLPSDTQYYGSIKAKGKGTVQLFITTADWKIDKEWKTGYRSSKTYPLSDEMEEYRFLFPAPARNHPVKFRVDIESPSTVELSDPCIRIANDKTLKNYLRKDAHEITLPVTINSREKTLFGLAGSIKNNECIRIDFPQEIALPSGSLSFWLKSDKDYIFKNEFKQLWSFPESGLNGRMAYGRLYFGNHYFCINNRIYSDEWHHLVYTWDHESGKQIFFDGKPAWVNGSPVARVKAKCLIFGKNLFGPGYEGKISSIRLFHGVVSNTEVEKLYSEFRPHTAFPLDLAGIAGQKNSIRICIDNGADENSQSLLTASIKAPDGNIIHTEEIKINSQPGNYGYGKISFTPFVAGDYLITLSTRKGDHLSYGLAIISPKPISPDMPTGEASCSLIQEIDCAKKPSKETYRDDGNCYISEFSGKKFRETGSNDLNSGFAYRLHTNEPGKVHWLEIEYPDDCSRTFYCSVGMIYNNRLCSGFLDAFGIITGETFPNTGEFKKKRFLFIPDSKDFAAIFCSYYNYYGEKGPAISKIRLYKVTGPLPRNKLNRGGRQIMIWNEDPTMFAYSWFKQYKWNKETTCFDFLREKIDRMVRYTRYIGWSKWNMLCNDYQGDNTAGDRRFISSSYSAGGGFLPGHLDMLAVTAEREKIPFFLSMNHMSMWKDGSIAGFGMEVGQNRISSNFSQAEKRKAEAPELFSSENKIAKGVGNTLNPIHPLVRSTLKRMIKAYVTKYKRYPMFQGLDYQSNQPLHFASSDFGYGDYNTNLYRRECSSSLPEYKGAKRFGKRKKWLKNNEWDKWLNWRCDKVVELVKELAGLLGERKLIFRVFISKLNSLQPLLKKGLLPDMEYLYKEQGIDLKKLTSIPNLCIMPDFRPNYSRTSNKAGDEYALNFSDKLASLWSIPSIDSAQITMHSTIEIWNNISKSKIKNLWGAKSHVSFSITMPNDDYVLENFTWLLAEADPFLINYGWWGNPESGADRIFRKFYHHYSYIPQRHFLKVQGTNDPVTVRQSGKDIYMVNMAPFPSKISISGGKTFNLVDKISGKTINTLNIPISGHGLRVFQQNQPVAITSVVQSYPLNFRKNLFEKLKKVQNDSQIRKMAKKYFSDGKLISATRMLNAYSLRKEWQKQSYTTRLNVNSKAKTIELLTRNNTKKKIPVKIKFIKTSPKQFEYILQPHESEKIELSKLENPYQNSRQEFQVEIICKNRRERLIEAWQPYIAGYNNDINIDGNISEWNHSRWYIISTKDSSKLLRHKTLPLKDNFQAQIAISWNHKGIAAAVVVDDYDFYPPQNTEKMWLNDMLIFYFDQKNDSSSAKSYQTDDLPFRFALVNNHPMVLNGVSACNCPKSKLAVSHKDHKTIYELFIPQEALPDFHLTPDNSSGFSFEIINKTKTSGVAVLSSSNEEPHNNPSKWADIILKQ